LYGVKDENQKYLVLSLHIISYCLFSTDPNVFLYSNVYVMSTTKYYSFYLFFIIKYYTLQNMQNNLTKYTWYSIPITHMQSYILSDSRVTVFYIVQNLLVFNRIHFIVINIQCIQLNKCFQHHIKN